MSTAFSPSRRPGGRRRAAIALLAFAVAPDVGLGLYHLTHRGAGSGVTELAFGGLLLLTLYLVFYAGRSREAAGAANHFRQAGLAIIGAIAAVLFVLSIYHLTHQGPGSFITELSLACVLSTVIYLVITPQKR